MQELSIVERRNYTRHDVVVPTRYWVDDERAAIPCDVLDISLGGMCIELPTWAWVDPGSYASAAGGIHVGTVQVPGGDTRRVHMRFLDTSAVFHGLIQAATDTWQARCCE